MVNRGLNFNFDLDGLADFEDKLKDMEKEFVRNVETGMREYSMLAEEGSRSLAPRDSGDLESSIHATLPVWVGDRIESSVGSNLSYALSVHERPQVPGTRDKYDNGVKFERYYLNGKGRRTFRKANWRGLKAGRKFIERAVVATEEEYEQIMAEALEKTLGGN
ncbi:hypothetical protein QOZ98_000502 [Planomicrobium stackebrandtii]|uniref:HK97 gp10 family phage protein n=1 Tax=Planomicrobium stackebrandtii TaxID=253160 RepID=A0ABU0GQQ5_9BACL|nr:HK97 gp10 family phage protein [Planomicrobium stackebrandtii]MDQ0427677.1 hypothetical protein [Planomicrobium stackebrandtii]